MQDAVREALDATGMPFEVLACDPEFADTAAFCAHYGFAPEDSANMIVVVSKKEPSKHCACVVLSNTRLDVNHKVCELLGVNKASFASPDATKELTGMLIGGVTAFGLPSEVPLYVDERVMTRQSVILGGGDRSSKVRISPEVFRRMPGAAVISGLANEPHTS